MIAVIMSTYNGEKYLPQQLDSVLRQTLEDFILIIRDDGSSDGTVPLLRGYTDERIVLLEGENVGPCRSFALLLQEAARRGAQQVYFCDQDDVWLPDKLARMEPLLRETDVPKLVFSDFSTIDGDGVRTGGSYAASAGLRIPQDGDFFPKLLAQPYVFGGAGGINRRLLELSLDLPDGIEMYDCWIALTAALLGKVEYLPEQTIQHRFHSSNATGRAGQNSFLMRLKRVSRGFGTQRENTALRLRQVTLLRRQYAELLPPETDAMLAALERAQHGGPAAVSALKKRGVGRGGAMQNLFFYLTVLMQ